MKFRKTAHAGARGLAAMTRRTAMLAAAGLVTFPTTGAAVAQDNWPQRPVEIICPFAAGGGTDLLARALADALSADLGQPFQVINRPGGSGVVGFEAIASSEPDGYTIGILTAQLITQNLRGVMELSYEDFTPISMVTVDHAGFAVNSQSSIQDFEGFLEAARQNPGELTVGNGGEGGSFHMLARNLEEQADVSFKHVPFEGGPAAILQLLGGHIDATVNGPTELLPYVGSGQLRMLAVAGENRRDDMPNVPTTAELGYPLNISTWRGVGAPAGVPEEIVEKLEAAISRAVETEPFKKAMENIGSNIEYMDSKGLMDFIERQEEAYRKIFG